jgi:hypothetical protein
LRARRLLRHRPPARPGDLRGLLLGGRFQARPGGIKASPRLHVTSMVGVRDSSEARRTETERTSGVEIADRVHTALARSRRSDVSLVFPTPSLTVAPYPSSDLPASRRPQAVTVYAAAAGAL